nr:FlgD immunoglobulin-like domain containing protein [Hymenobacter sp. BRD67]
MQSLSVGIAAGANSDSGGDWGGASGTRNNWESIPDHQSPATKAVAEATKALIENDWDTHRKALAAQDAVPPGDQYLLGPNLLVAPVNQPGQRRRNVQLPATPGGWIDFETGQTLPDGQTVGLPAPLSRLPLLVRAGAFVPMTAYRPSTAQFRPDTLVVRYFPDWQVPAPVFTSYEDDGHSAQALARREFATLRLTGRLTANQAIITATVAGTYPGAPVRRLVRLRVARVAAAPSAVLLGGQPLTASAWQLDGSRHEISLEFPLEKQAVVTLVGLRLLTAPAAQTDPETLTLTAPDNRTFTGSVGLHYERYVPADSPAPLRIRNARGQLVRELPTETSAGTHALSWDGRDAAGRPAASGLYEVELAGQHQRLVRLPNYY